MFRQKSCWSRRTSMEKLLTALSVVGVLLIIGLIVGIVIVAQDSGTNNDVDNGNDNDIELCLTQGCIDTSANVLKQMDQSVKPYDYLHLI